MTGETDLNVLIAQMRPMLDPEPYVFCTFAGKIHGRAGRL
jgi:hypothetical protein